MEFRFAAPSDDTHSVVDADEKQEAESQSQFERLTPRSRIVTNGSYGSKAVYARKIGVKGAKWKYYDSGAEAARQLGLSRDMIRKCCKKLQPKNCEYECKYAAASDDKHGAMDANDDEE